MQDERLTPSEMELEAALSGLKPAGAIANRDRVMFLAGRASMRRRSHLWQGASAFLTIALIVSLLVRPKPETSLSQRDLIVVVNDQARSLSVASDATSDVDSAKVQAYREYVRLRRAVLERGVDALPAATVAPANESTSSTSYRQLKDLLSAT